MFTRRVIRKFRQNSSTRIRQESHELCEPICLSFSFPQLKPQYGPFASQRGRTVPLRSKSHDHAEMVATVRVDSYGGVHRTWTDRSGWFATFEDRKGHKNYDPDPQQCEHSGRHIGSSGTGGDTDSKSSWCTDSMVRLQCYGRNRSAATAL